MHEIAGGGPSDNRGTYEKNLRQIKKICPGAPLNTAIKRIRSIEWLVSRRAKVCEITANSRCNYRCRFCYNPPGFFEKAAVDMRPGIDEIARVLYVGRTRGCWIAAFIGGEPTLREDLPKLASLARKLGYPCVKVCSNGSLLADRTFVRGLASAGVNMFDLSLHGATDKIHDSLVGRAGAFRAVMAAADNIRAVGKELGVNQVVNKLNYRSFPEFFDLAFRELGINYFNIIYGHYRGVMAENMRSLIVPVSKTVPYLKEGLSVIERSGLPAFSRMLVNFTPCLLPGYEAVIADWERLDDEEPLLRSDGSVADMEKMKAAQNIKPGSCGACVHFGRCRGFDKEYYDVFGASEFSPLRRNAVPAGPKVLFAREDR